MKIGKTDAFEDAYMAKFRAIASYHGVFVEYARDAAARDIGLHFTQITRDGSKAVTPALAWFQMKGVMSSTLSAEAAKANDCITLSLSANHLKFWYLQPTPTYLVAYVEALDRFQVINIKRWVEETLGSDILTNTQKSYSVKIPLSEQLDTHAFQLIMRDNMVDTLKRLLNEDDAEAKRFFRDAEVVKWMNTCEASGTTTRLIFTSWISKMRSEARFEFLQEGEWQTFRNHWQYALDGIEEAFPYIEFVGLNEDEFEQWRDENEEDTYDAEQIPLQNGTVSVGPNCGNEFYLHELAIKLNVIGQRWAETLAALEAADAITVETKSGGFISVAPWHARQL